MGEMLGMMMSDAETGRRRLGGACRAARPLCSVRGPVGAASPRRQDVQLSNLMLDAPNSIPGTG